MKGDHKGQKLHRMLIMNKPGQHYLNAVFKAESAFTNVVSHALCTPRAHDAPSVGMRDVQMDAIMQNWRFLSGDRGKSVVMSYLKLATDFTAPGWTGFDGGRAVKFAAAEKACTSSAVAHRRLVLYFQHPKFLVFRISASVF